MYHLYLPTEYYFIRKTKAKVHIEFNLSVKICIFLYIFAIHYLLLNGNIILKLIVLLSYIQDSGAH